MDDTEQDIDVTPVNSTQPSRPGTPDSCLTNSFMRANATIDDLTSNLVKVSRAPTPDAANPLLCCCGREDCENTRAWIAHQAKLESRLVLSAEVGQALLQRHEAYVRRNESMVTRSEVDKHAESGSSQASSTSAEDMLARISHLVKENGALEKRLNAALLNHEVAEASTKVIMQELEDAKAVVARLTLNQAKSVGWDVRLNNAVQERDDLKQELEVERQRNKSSDGHIAILKERCSKMQNEINQLHDDLERQKCSRTELSEEILRDARARLEMLLQARFGRSTVTDQPEVTEVMESLVADNEALKRDIAELQNLLAESREDVRALREEMEEARVHVPPTTKEIAKAIPTHIRTHHHTTSWGSSFGQDFRAIASPGLQLSFSSQSGRRSSPAVQRRSSDNEHQPSSRPPSAEPSSAVSYEPPTPATSHRPLSPADSNAPSETNVQSLSSPQPSYPASQISIDVEKSKRDSPVESSAKPRTPRRPLFLLTQSRGVQTEDSFWPIGVDSSLKPPSFSDRLSSTPPLDGHSESSSLVDPNGSTVSALIDRINTLFTRLAQADARTLTNRLKRQHLTGDVGHLSRTTVTAILADVNALRKHFRSVLEDDKVVSTCTRREFRALLTLFKEIFSELATMRMTLNDVILDPSIASKVSEVAMNPTKEGADRVKTSGATLGGWMAPIAKLFGTPTSEDKPPPSSRTTPANPRGRPPFAASKQAPALAASTVAVNVEFSGAGTGRAVSTSDSLPRPVAIPARPAMAEHDSTSSSKAVMGIFAGAPRPAPNVDPWVVVGPRPPRGLRSGVSANNLNTATITRATGRKLVGQRLSRNVDAVIDNESVLHDSDDNSDQEEGNTTLLERTLRPRGLSDSSIHSTFLDQAPKGERHPESNVALPHASTSMSTGFDGRPSVRQGAYPNRQSVLASLGKRMHIFKGSPSVGNPSTPTKRVSLPVATAEATATQTEAAPAVNADTQPQPVDSSPPMPIRTTSPRRLDILPSLAAWAASTAGLENDLAEEYVGSVQGDSTMHGARSPPAMSRAWSRRQDMDLE